MRLKHLALFALGAGLGASTFGVSAQALTATDIHAIVAGLGYQVMRVELDGSVFEVKALSDTGAPVELHFDATTGQQVGSADGTEAGDDNGVDGPGHDVGDDHGGDDQAGDDVGSDDSGDDHGGGGSSGGSGGGGSDDGGSDDSGGGSGGGHGGDD